VSTVRDWQSRGKGPGTSRIISGVDESATTHAWSPVWEPPQAGGEVPDQIRRMSWAVLLCALVGLAMPAVCAWADGVLTRADMAGTLLEAEHCSNRNLDPARSQLGVTCMPPGGRSPSANEPTSDGSGAIGSKTKTDGGRLVVAFFPGLTTPAWPLALLVLAAVFVLFAPHRDGNSWPEEKIRKCWVRLGLTFTALTVGSNLLRELAPSSIDRVVYSMTNFDIAPFSACAYLGLFTCMSWAIALIWTRWLAAEGPQIRANPIDAALDPSLTRGLSKEFDRWIWVSGLIIAAFLPGTFLYWEVVHRYHDLRYVLPAGIYHALYALTWLVVSKPLLRHRSVWHHCRGNAIAEAARNIQQVRSGDAEAQEFEIKKLDGLIKALAKLQPVPRAAAIVAVFTALASILAPLYQLSK
jgi:hypothetical protein